MMPGKKTPYIYRKGKQTFIQTELRKYYPSDNSNKRKKRMNIQCLQLNRVKLFSIFGRLWNANEQVTPNEQIK